MMWSSELDIASWFDFHVGFLLHAVTYNIRQARRLWLTGIYYQVVIHSWYFIDVTFFRVHQNLNTFSSIVLVHTLCQSE